MSKIVCFGEVLWDLLPTGKIAGGAPMNVAYHLTRLGYPTVMISSIGNDKLGNELIQFLKTKKVDTQLVQMDQKLPTGIVNVTLSSTGQPSYEIVEPVAWDNIPLNSTIKKNVESSDIMVFGSLAARNATTRQTLFQLLEVAKFKIFDVNLRPPFYTKSVLEYLLKEANIVKMNDEELEIIGAWHNLKGVNQATAETIRKVYNLQGIIVTKGADGAIYVSETDYIEQTGFPIMVQDTIGSGDAFLAGFICQYLNGVSPQKRLEFACATGAYVATQQGGTPPNSKKIIDNFIKNRKGN